MRTIAHLSDLHFGREDPRAVEALLADLRALSPSLVAVSGDLTQRARRAEFARARAFLARLPARALVVPGNHDVPLFDLPRRLLSPLGRYRAFVGADLAPSYEDEELLVLGINTARALTWKAGRISHAQMEALRSRLCGDGPDRLHVLVAHHPFSPPRHAPRTRAVGRAAAALAAVAGCGLDVVLTGHLHREFAGDLGGETLARAALALHAGSAVSRRLRGELNSYNLVRVRGLRLDLEVRALGREGFAPARRATYLRTGDGWVPVPASPAAEPARPP